jgi:hypothetical protein
MKAVATTKLSVFVSPWSEVADGESICDNHIVTLEAVTQLPTRTPTLTSPPMTPGPTRWATRSPSPTRSQSASSASTRTSSLTDPQTPMATVTPSPCFTNGAGIYRRRYFIWRVFRFAVVTGLN